MKNNGKNLWELLWDYDPNGLVVVNSKMLIQVVNAAFCQMFKVSAKEIIGKNLSGVLEGDVEHFQAAWDRNRVIRDVERAYFDNTLFVRKVIFPVKEEDIVACIMVDLTPEWQQRNEIHRIRRDAIAEVNKVVDEQMHVAQKIAGLLGETTAETKIGLLNLVKIIDKDQE